MTSSLLHSNLICRSEGRRREREEIPEQHTLHPESKKTKPERRSNSFNAEIKLYLCPRNATLAVRSTQAAVPEY